LEILYRAESSGKTTLALHIVAEAQKLGGVCAYIDAEHAMDPDYASKLGVKINDLLISQPDTGEQGLEITESLVRSGKIDVIVVDSVAALTPRIKRSRSWGIVFFVCVRSGSAFLNTTGRNVQQISVGFLTCLPYSVCSKSVRIKAFQAILLAPV
jgi:predicted ATP-dependent serine protease